MTTASCSFQYFLKQELQERSRNNPLYSIRAFARDLEVNDSTLSKLLAGKLNFSPKRIQKMGAALKLAQKEINEFIATLNSRFTPTKELDYQQLKLDQFECASKWYHDAIIELAKVEGIRPTGETLSQLLDISIEEAQNAIDRLLRLGLVSLDKNGFLQCQLEHSTTNYDENIYTNELLKDYQKQILNLSLTAVDKVPKGRRSHNSIILSIDSTKLDEFHELMRRQQQELLSFIEENSTQADSVYAIQLASFPLTKVKEKQS